MWYFIVLIVLGCIALSLYALHAEREGKRQFALQSRSLKLTERKYDDYVEHVKTQQAMQAQHMGLNKGVVRRPTSQPGKITKLFPEPNEEEVLEELNQAGSEEEAKDILSRHGVKAVQVFDPEGGHREIRTDE